jgi:hypothetical protein
MTALRERKTRLTFETDQEVRYRGQDASCVAKSVVLRGSTGRGTRVVYEIGWRTIFTRADPREGRTAWTLCAKSRLPSRRIDPPEQFCT